MFRRKHNSDLDATLAAEAGIIAQVMQHTSDGRPPIFGAPCPCPRCGQWGLVEREVPGAADHSCAFCGIDWTITRRALQVIGRGTELDSSVHAVASRDSMTNTTPHRGDDGATVLRLVPDVARPSDVEASMERHPSRTPRRRQRPWLVRTA